MRNILISFFLLSCLTCKSQAIVISTDSCKYLYNKELNENILDTVLTTAEQMPQFRGGDSEMIKFVFDNIKIPTIKIGEEIVTRATVRFIVRKTGKVENVKAIGVYKDSELAKSLVKAIELMPDWYGGKDKGKPVDVYFTFPLHVDYRK